MKILSIGNSFGADTMEYLGHIAREMGVEAYHFANLYVGGCSIRRHYHNAVNDIAEYNYYSNSGEGWSMTPGYSIAATLAQEDWDYVSIQHGTSDGSRYTKPESYDDLAALVAYVKERTKAKVAFNMAWAMDPESTHKEMVSYGGDQKTMYANMTKITRELVSPLVDVVSPTGTAIQNARQVVDKKLTRDNFHLSLDLGRYIAGLTYGKALCGWDIRQVTWRPEGVTQEEAEKARWAAISAVNNPYSVTAK